MRASSISATLRLAPVMDLQLVEDGDLWDYYALGIYELKGDTLTVASTVEPDMMRTVPPAERLATLNSTV